MKKIFFILYEITIIIFQIKNENIKYLTEGYYEINSNLNNLYLSVKNKKLIISNIQFFFKIIPLTKSSYIIKFKKEKVGIDDNNKIIVYNNIENIEIKKYCWKFYNIKRNQYLIKNEYNNKLIEVCDNYIKISNNNIYNIDKKNVFTFLKLFEEELNQKKFKKIINKEPIDVLIKYIDLSDKTLNRTGINQIYKDENCEELKYSIRSILQNIPWIRKIFSFNLFRMKKYGISNNFIYMDDDCFIGQYLQKDNLFYFNEKNGIIVPYVISNKVFTINKNKIYDKYYKLMKKNSKIHPHSGDGFNLEILCTQKFYIDYYDKSLINCRYTHNAFPENIKDLEEIFELSQNYKYFKEMIYSKERFILSFYHQMFYNIYQLNINYRKIHFMFYKYISIENIKQKKNNLNAFLFVINTGGNHEPLLRQKKILKNVLEKKFPFPTKYEINFKAHKIYKIRIKNILLFFIIFLKIKIIILIFDCYK